MMNNYNSLILNLDKEVVFVTIDPDKWILRKSYYKPGLPVSDQ